MKKILPLLIVLLLAACAGPTPAPPTPTPIPPTETDSALTLPLIESPQLNQFYFVDENNGWGLTETSVVRTTDGGVTWYDATPIDAGPIGYAPFVFPSAKSGYFLLANEDYTSGTLYRTTDGGVTWTPIAVPFAAASLQFIDADVGFALAALGAGAGSEAVALFKTIDGGATWTRVFTNDPSVDEYNDTLPLGGQKTGFSFLNSSRGFVGGSVPVDNYIYLYATPNGGETWMELKPALPAGYEMAQTGNDGPQFFSRTDGILIVHLSVPFDPSLLTVAYRTNDGGLTWTPGQIIPRGRPAEFFSFNDGVAWGGGQFYVTHDAGQTWGSVNPSENFTDSLVSFQFVNTLVGFVLTNPSGSDPALYKTTDGGANWTLIIP